MPTQYPEGVLWKSTGSIRQYRKDTLHLVSLLLLLLHSSLSIFSSSFTSVVSPLCYLSHAPNPSVLCVYDSFAACFFNSYPSQCLLSPLLHLLPPLFSILAPWMVTSHRCECNMSLFFLLGLTGPGDRAGPSIINETYCKGQRGEGERNGERRRQRALQRTAFIWHAVRETGLRQQNHQREREGPLWMGRRPLWDRYGWWVHMGVEAA